MWRPNNRSIYKLFCIIIYSITLIQHCIQKLLESSFIEIQFSKKSRNIKNIKHTPIIDYRKIRDTRLHVLYIAIYKFILNKVTSLVAETGHLFNAFNFEYKFKSFCKLCVHINLLYFKL